MKKLRHDVARRDHYEELTNTIIAKLEDGVLPWRRPWDPKKCSAGASPMNPVTGRTYRGVNALALAMSPRAFGGDPRWMSYRQAAARGWQVRKGEKGAIVFFYKKLEIRSDDEDKRTIPLLRAYVVFHASQLDGIPELGEPEAPKPVAERIADADLIVKASGVRVADRRRPGLLRPVDRPHPDAAGRGLRKPARLGCDHPARARPRERRTAPPQPRPHRPLRRHRLFAGRTPSRIREPVSWAIRSGCPATFPTTQATFSPGSRSSRTTSARSFAPRPTPIGSPNGSSPTIRRTPPATTIPTRRTMSSRRSLRLRP